MSTGEYAVPPPNAYSPFGFVPKIVASLFNRISAPHFSACAPCVYARSSLIWYKFPNDPKIDPYGLLNPAYRPSLNVIAGCVWFSAGKNGVLRIYPNAVVELSFGVIARVSRTAAFRW